MHLLVPTDFSENAWKAFEYAWALARQSNGKITIMHSYDPPGGGAGMLVNLEDKLVAQAEAGQARWKEKVAQVHAEYGETKPEVDFVLTQGGPVNECFYVGEDVSADMVVMGTKGSSGLEEVFIGSVTAAVIERATIPVMAVPADTSHRHLDRLTIALDGFEGRGKYFNVLLPLLKALGGVKVSAVHIAKEEGDFEAGKQQFLSELDDHEGVEVEVLVRISEGVLEGIEGFLTESNADALAMITRKRGFFGKFFNPSITRKMAMHSKIPLIAMQVES